MNNSNTGSKREDGYYWVNIKSCWYVCEYNNNYGWTMTGSDKVFTGSIFDEIGERILPPNEVK